MGLTAWGWWVGMAGVPEYDAFGREVQKDRPRPEPAVVVEPEPAPVAPPRRERIVRPQWGRGRGGGLAGWLVLLAFLGAALLGVVGTSVDGGVDGGPGGPAIEAPGPAAGLKRASLIRERNFAEVVDTLSHAGLGRPLTMRVAPDRIDAALLDKEGVHHVRITSRGELDELATTAASSAAGRRTIAYEKIDVSAPQHLVRAGATRHNLARRIDYLVLTPGPPTTWAAYFKGGRIVVGDAHGRKRRVI